MKGSVHFFRGIFRTKGEAERTGRICAEGFVRTWGTVETDAGHDPVSIVQFKGGTSHIHFKCLDRDDGTAVLCVFVQSLQRDRRTEEGWKAPKGGRLALSVSRWGVCLLNELYVGENMLPFWDIYGYGLYAGTPFYGTPKKIYNQTAVTYNRRFFNNTVGVSAGFYFHYDGVGLGLQQILKVSVNLQKTVYRPKK